MEEFSWKQDSEDVKSNHSEQSEVEYSEESEDEEVYIPTHKQIASIFEWRYLYFVSIALIFLSVGFVFLTLVVLPPSEELNILLHRVVSLPLI